MSQRQFVGVAWHGVVGVDVVGVGGVAALLTDVTVCSQRISRPSE